MKREFFYLSEFTCKRMNHSNLDWALFHRSGLVQLEHPLTSGFSIQGQYEIRHFILSSRIEPVWYYRPVINPDNIMVRIDCR